MVIVSLLMLLSLARFVGIGPFDDLTIPFADEEGHPRHLVVLFGGEGVGKTSICTALASTRPGHTSALLLGKHRNPIPPFAVADWVLGDDDTARPHPLRVASPNAVLDEREDAALIRRREQTLFDRKASEGGFVFVAFSGARWFSKMPVLLTTPERSILRYDLRGGACFDDATRADLTRETKQVLSYVAVANALCRGAGGEAADGPAGRFAALDHSLREVLDTLLGAVGCRYVGVDPTRLEPLFQTSEERLVELEDLPKSARHLCAFGALTLKALAAAYPTKNAAEAEGVVLIDDVETQLDCSVERHIGHLLHAALPRVQWILTTSSPRVTLGCELHEVLALRRTGSSGRVSVHEGSSAIIH